MHTRTAAHEPIPPAASCSEPSFIGARDTRPFVYQLSAASFALRPQSSWDRDRTAHKENKLLLPGPLQKKFADPCPKLEKAMAPHSSTHAWKIPWTEEPGGLQSMGSRRVRHD